jgi:hypothetical protein
MGVNNEYDWLLANKRVINNYYHQRLNINTNLYRHPKTKLLRDFFERLSRNFLICQSSSSLQFVVN